MARATSAGALTVDDCIRRFASRLADADVAFGHGTDNPVDEAYRLVVGGLHGRTLTSTTRAELEVLLERRIAGRVPVPWLTREAWLAGVRFDVPPGVMIPRSPIALALTDKLGPWLGRPPRRVLDLCCGTGALGILAAYAFLAAQVELVDVDPVAIAAAQQNVDRHGLADRVDVIRSDLFGSVLHSPYDLILCNPPYVPTGELDAAPAEFRHEPRLGLDGGHDGLAVWRRIVSGLDSHLATDGVLVGETGNVSARFAREFSHLAPVWLELDGAERQAGDDCGVFVLVPAMRTDGRAD